MNNNSNDNDNVKELIDKFINIKKMGWIEGDKKNRGSAGILFEKLLNNGWNNFELPDYNNIEIKTKSSSKEKYITLFSAVPDSFLFEIKRIVNEYGYPDKDYPQFNILNISLYNNVYKKGGNKKNLFKLNVNNINNNVILEIYDLNYNMVDNNSKWSFDIIKEKLTRKLNYMALIDVEKKYINNSLFFKYNKITIYKLKSFDKFIDLIKKGKIRITLQIGIYKNQDKIGKIYDHGSSFCIKKEDISLLFQKINEYK